MFAFRWLLLSRLFIVALCFGLPFCIGAVLLSQSGFFQIKKDTSQQARNKDYASIGGTLVIVTAVINMIIVLIPNLFEPYSMLTQWVNIGNMFAGDSLIAGVLLLIMGIACSSHCMGFCLGDSYPYCGLRIIVLQHY